MHCYRRLGRAEVICASLKLECLDRLNRTPIPPDDLAPSFGYSERPTSLAIAARTRTNAEHFSLASRWLRRIPMVQRAGSKLADQHGCQSVGSWYVPSVIAVSNKARRWIARPSLHHTVSNDETSQQSRKSDWACTTPEEREPSRLPNETTPRVEVTVEVPRLLGMNRNGA